MLSFNMAVKLDSYGRRTIESLHRLGQRQVSNNTVKIIQ